MKRSATTRGSGFYPRRRAARAATACLYGTDHFKRLNFVRRARALGFSIDEVRTLLRLADERKRPCSEVRGVAEAHLRDVHAKIADLRTMERVLKETVARCADGTGSTAR